MNERPDDPHLDPDLRAALRQRASEAPRVEVDARILAAAHRAVSSRPRGSGLRRWLPRIDTPFATAAVVMVSAALLMMMREHGHSDQVLLREIERQAEPAAAGASATAKGSTAVSAAPADTPSMRSPPTVDAMTNANDAPAGTAADRAVPAETPAAPALPASPAASPPPLGNQDAAEDEFGKRLEGQVERKAVTTETREASRHDAAPAPVSANEAPAAAKAQAFPGGEAQPPAGLVPLDDSGVDPHSFEQGIDRKSNVAAPTVGARPEPDAATMSLPAEAATVPPAVDQKAPPAMGVERAESEAMPVPATEQDKALQNIRMLIQGGRFSEARLALARFVRAHPDYRVPADILEALKPAD